MKSHFTIGILLIFFTGCTVVVPEVDETPPVIRFEISGEDVERTFVTEDDFSEQLNLVNDATYRFEFTASDQGGMQLIRWQLPENATVEFQTEIPEEWTVHETSPLSRMIEWTGDESAPITGSVLIGRFTIHADNTSFDMQFQARDFGGRDGAANTTTRTLNVFSEVPED